MSHVFPILMVWRKKNDQIDACQRIAKWCIYSFTYSFFSFAVLGLSSGTRLPFEPYLQPVLLWLSFIHGLALLPGLAPD
jgi:hypothetical protein